MVHPLVHNTAARRRCICKIAALVQRKGRFTGTAGFRRVCICFIAPKEVLRQRVAWVAWRHGRHTHDWQRLGHRRQRTTNDEYAGVACDRGIRASRIRCVVGSTRTHIARAPCRREREAMLVAAVVCHCCGTKLSNQRLVDTRCSLADTIVCWRRCWRRRRRWRWCWRRARRWFRCRRKFFGAVISVRARAILQVSVEI